MSAIGTLRPCRRAATRSGYWVSSAVQRSARDALANIQILAEGLFRLHDRGTRRASTASSAWARFWEHDDWRYSREAPLGRLHRAGSPQ